MNGLRTGLLAAALLAAAAPESARAELSASNGSSNPRIHFITSDGRIWTPVRQGIDPRLVLNADGDSRGDGLPSFGVNASSDQPEVVWSRFEGHYRVVFSRFNGQDWTPPVGVSGNGPGNDTAPVLGWDVEAGRVVIWTRAEDVVQVYGTAAPRHRDEFLPAARFSTPGLPARSATLAVSGETMYVAFAEEEQDAEYVVVMGADTGSCRSGAGTINPFRIASSDAGPGPSTASSPGPMDPISPVAPVVHEQDGHVWVDWIRDDATLAWFEVTGSDAGPVDFVPIRNGDVDRARQDVADIVTGR